MPNAEILLCTELRSSGKNVTLGAHFVRWVLIHPRAQADAARRGAAAKTEVIWLDFTVGSEIDY